MPSSVANPGFHVPCLAAPGAALKRMTQNQLPPAQDALFGPLPGKVLAPKKQRGDRTPVPALPAPPYGLRSSPGYAPGLNASGDDGTELPFELIPLPNLGVEQGHTGKKARRAANALAITVARSGGELTGAGRAALMGYSGGGGLDGESLTAFYTPTALAAYTWALVSKLHEGRLKTALEPSCGTGAFLLTAPAGVQVTGVEFDPDAAGIASLLSPHASVHQLTFEDYTTRAADPYADVVVGNPPFGDRGRLRDERGLERAREERHEWFFLNSALSRVKPGGLVALILPEDLVREEAYRARRRELLGRAAVVGVISVPTGAFAASGAGVMTALLIVRRHDQGAEAGLRLLDDTDREEHTPDGAVVRTIGERRALLETLGAWDQPFVDGQTTFVQQGGAWKPVGLNVCKAALVGHSRYGDPQLGGEMQLSQVMLDTHLAHLKVNLRRAVSRSALLSAVRGQHGPEREQQVQAAMRGAPAFPIPNGFTSQGGLFRFSHGAWSHADHLNTPEAQTAILLARELTAERLTGLSSPRRTELSLALAAQDDGLQGERLLKLAKRFPLLHIVLAPPAPPTLNTRATLLPGALEDVAGQLADLHLLSAAQLSEVSGETLAACEAHLLANYRFSGECGERRWLRKSDSDFGHAYDRASQLRALARSFAGVEARALELQADDFERRALAQWKPLTDCDLTPRDSVVPAECLEAWLDSYLNLEGDRQGAVQVSREGHVVSLRVRSTLAPQARALDLAAIDSGTVKGLESCLNYATRRDLVSRQNKSRDEIRAQEAASLKRASRFERSVEAHWRNWIITSAFASELENRYNRARNAVLTAPEDVRPMNLGQWKGPALHLYQRRDVRALAAWGHGLLNYGVGLGKTYAALALIGLLKDRREARLPMLVTPLSLTGNWVQNVRRARPDWTVLSIGMTPTGEHDEFGEPEYAADSTQQRQAKLASIMSNPPDLVIISIETFVDIPMQRETLLELIEEDACVMAGAKQAAADSFDAAGSRFGGHRRAATFESEVGDMLSRSRVGTDTELVFEMLGVDCLIFEEAHKFKNLWAAPQYLGEVPKFMGAGLESKRAMAAYHRARYVRRHHRGRGTYALSATPWKNSPLECMYALSLITDDLRASGLDTPMSFMLRYCEIEQRIVTSPDGEVGLRNCVTGFKNLSELQALIKGHVIAENALECQMDDRTGLPLPRLERLTHRLALTPQQEAAYHGYRAEAANPDREGKNHLFSILSRMEAAVIDPAGAGIGGANPRAQKAAELASQAHHEGYGSVTFLDRGGDAEHGAYRVYVEAYVRAGIPREKIEVVTAQSHPTPGSRMKVEARYARGELRHVLGGSIIREGFNLQHETAAIINCDQPHDPEDKTQRTGRGWRQGNLAPYVREHDLLAVGSSDALRYTNLMGKAGWIAGLKSGEDRASNHAAFDAVGVALLLSSDPDAAKKVIDEKMQSLNEDAARAEQAHTLNLLRSFSEAVSLIRQRWEKAREREHGPGRQDRAGLAKLAGQLGTLARAVHALPEDLKRVLYLVRRPEWVHHLPLVPGVSVIVDTARVDFRGVNGPVINLSGRSYSADDLLGAHSLRLPDAPEAYGPCLTRWLPEHLRGEIDAALAGNAPLPEASDAHVDEVTPEPGDLSTPAAPPALPVAEPFTEPPALHVQLPGSLPSTPPVHLVPIQLADGYAVSVRKDSFSAHQLYQVCGDTLILIPHGSVPQTGETFLGLYERRGRLSAVALIPSADRYAQLAQRLRSGPEAFRARINALLQARLAA